ncbi:MAG: UMP kinase, partial [Spirochaetales bacterium]
ARAWQQAYRTVADSPSDSEADWIGIAATRLNARLVKAVFSEFCTDEVATDPTAAFGFTGRVLVAAGWKPGFSTDYDAVLLAERFGAKLLINLSNIEKVFTDDPKKNPAAKPIEDITWQEFQNIVGTEWVPGKNSPFDPVATDRARKLGLTVIVAAGKDTENLARILNGGPFTGTTIHP